MSLSFDPERDRKLDDVRLSVSRRCALGAPRTLPSLSLYFSFSLPTGDSPMRAFVHTWMSAWWKKERKRKRKRERREREGEGAKGSFGARFLGMLPPTESQVPMLSVSPSLSLFEGPTASLSGQRAPVCHLSLRLDPEEGTTSSYL